MSAAGSVNGGVLPDRPDLPDPSLYLVLPHLPRERIAVDAECVGGLRETAVAASEYPHDEAFLELVNRVLELDALVHHFSDERFQTIADRALHRPPALHCRHDLVAGRLRRAWARHSRARIHRLDPRHSLHWDFKD